VRIKNIKMSKLIHYLIEAIKAHPEDEEEIDRLVSLAEAVSVDLSDKEIEFCKKTAKKEVILDRKFLDLPLH